MKLVALAGVAAIVMAQLVRGAATNLVDDATVPAPYIPSPDSSRLLSLGYNEVAADLLFFRLVGYFGTRGREADAMAGLVEAIVTLDPHFYPAYTWGARAMAHAINQGVGRDHYLRAIRVLERGMKEFPDDYRLPQLAGEIYLLDLKTEDPGERRAWDAVGTALLERAVRKPEAPASLGTWIAHLRTKLGQKERAITELRELLLITNDQQARDSLLEKLAELEGTTSGELAAEIDETRRRFEKAWRAERPYLPASFYILVGPPITPGFDLTDLATGGRDLVESTLDRAPP